MQRAKHGGELLPDALQALAPLITDWSFATEYERREKRASTGIDDLRTYYDRVGPRMRDIVAHLNRFPMGPLPAGEQALLQLALMFMEVALAVEFYGQPEVKRGFPRNRWIIAPR